jgi:thymidine kinase
MNKCAICKIAIYGSTGFCRAKYHLLYLAGKISRVKTLCGMCTEIALRRVQKIPKGVLF